ncbi:unnamed protein product [Blepharisma stoltei]|uniref:Secreted protein n=1 Tax=Blepharisma stoltei TaxID=1481888 RepID=A0AAU9KAB5_9CILI|nr:unnamed protein product [Blepharisma stoltei]
MHRNFLRLIYNLIFFAYYLYYNMIFFWRAKQASSFNCVFWYYQTTLFIQCMSSSNQVFDNSARRPHDLRFLLFIFPA